MYIKIATPTAVLTQAIPSTSSHVNTNDDMLSLPATSTVPSTELFTQEFPSTANTNDDMLSLLATPTMPSTAVFTQEIPSTSSHVNTNNDMLSLPLTQSITIKYKSEYRSSLSEYMTDIMNIDASNMNNVLKTWSTLFTHMIVDILSRVSTVSRLRKYSDMDNNLKSSVFSKYILIEEVYNDHYNILHYDLVGIKQLAIHPRSNMFPIIGRYATSIFCHIYANEMRDEIKVDFFNTSDENIFNDFFNAFHENIFEIIEVYSKKISFYYIFNEYREYNFIDKLVTDRYDIDILTDRDQLRMNSKIIQFCATPNHLKTMEKFVQKFHPEINLDDDHLTICKLWAELTHRFMIDILTKIFAVKFVKNEHSLQFTGDNVISFDVTSTEDVIMYRSKYSKNNFHFRNGVLPREIYKTVSIIKNETTLFRPMRAILKITCSKDSHKIIKFKFFNLYGLVERPFKDILDRFEKIFPKLLDNYFEKLLAGFIIFTADNNYM